MGIISAWGAGTIHRTCPNMKLVRRRMQARLQKAVRNAEHGNPGCAKVVSRLGRAGLPVHRALNRIVADSNCELKYVFGLPSSSFNASRLSETLASYLPRLR